MDDISINILSTVHRSLCNGIRSAKADAPRKWLSDKKLSIEATGACFQSGQGHHRKPASYKESLERVGMLIRTSANTSTGEPAYVSFAPYSVLFPLKDAKGRTCNFYGSSLKTGKQSWLNREGIYPEYPKAGTQRLYIVEEVLDAATILQAGILDNREAVMALTSGELTEEHIAAIQALSGLQEIIFIHSEQPAKGQGK